MNKYVDFVSDEDFLECVEHVVNAYNSTNDFETPIELLENSKNTIDEFKTLFDVCVNIVGFDGWANFEILRQNDKTINNKIGEFHQKLLGKVDGWIDLETGDKTEVDLKKDDNSIFIELKNKYNTLNSSSARSCRQNLEKVINQYPNAVAYWAYVIGKDYKSEDKVWIYKGRENERIRRISGDKLYELVTGDPKALEKVYDAIPRAVVDLLGDDYILLPYDQKVMEEFKQYIFHNSE